MADRIAGFDLARAYAIFGMFIVNFNFCFGSVWQTDEPVGRFLNLFVGNSTAIFIILAGMGVSLMAQKCGSEESEIKKTKATILKRSVFLFIIGLLLFLWWPGDILHFYGSYMHFAAFMLFVPKRYLLVAAVAAIGVFHILLFIIPIETGWNFSIFQPVDFWTPAGFLRNTFYNGWNSVFPWIAYFFVGMWLGKLDWTKYIIRRNVFVCGLIVFLSTQCLRLLAKQDYFSERATAYIMSEYFPPYLPFMLITAGFALMAITAFIVIGQHFKNSKIIGYLAATGRLTLTHYIMHLTVGMLILSAVTGLDYSGNIQSGIHAAPLYILSFSIIYFAATVIVTVLWTRKFKSGPIEMLMRRFSR